MRQNPTLSQINLQKILQKRAQEMPKPQQPKRQILPPGYISTQDPTNTLGTFRNLTSTEVEYLKKGNKPYFRMTDQEKLNFKNTGTVPKIGRGNDTPTRTPVAEFSTPSAEQALPQPQMPPELQRLQDMSNALGKRIQSDPSMQRFQEQQRQIYSNIQQKTQNYINSLQQFLNTAPPEFRQFLSSPQTLSRLRMAYGEQLPEMNQVRNIGRQIQQYHQNTFGQEIQKIQQLQMQPQIQQYQYQMQLFNQQQQRQLRGPQGQTPTRAPTPIEQPQQDPIVDPKRPTTTVPKTITPIERPPVQPTVDPLRPTTTVPKTITPIERPPVQPTVDPVREPFIPKPEVDPSETLPPPTRIEKPTVRPIVDPKRPIKPADTTGARHSGQGLGGQGGLPSVTPIKGSGPKMIVDPLRPTTSVPKHSGEGIGGQGGIPAQPIGDPIKINTPTIVDPYAPTTTGLMPKSPKKRKAGLAPSQYRGIDTNVRGLMRQ